jgi:hypothetical protein
MQPAGEVDSAGQSTGRENLTGSYSSTGCIQVVKDEGNTCSTFFNLGQASTDLFVGFSKDEFVNFSLPFIPKFPAFII